MPNEDPVEIAFTAEAEAALSQFYGGVGATTTQQKIEALERDLGGPSNFYALGGAIDDEMKLGCLEYEFLVVRDLIDLVLV